MQKYFTAFQMTQSMFCSLPFPCRKWDENSRAYMLLFLPVVGLEIGALWVALDWVLRYFQIPGEIYGLVMCAWPYLATGFMHLDGFMDVTDAVGSWRDLQRRREILKDSHVGSFSVVWSTFLILAGFAAFSAGFGAMDRRLLCLIPVVSRCCSALAVMNLKAMNTSQYANTNEYPKWHSIFLILLIAGCLIFAFSRSYQAGFALVACLAGYGIALKKSYGSLQGMNGDISGFCLCIGELCAVIAAVLC